MSDPLGPEETTYELNRLQLRDLRERRRTVYEKRLLWFLLIVAFLVIGKATGAIPWY